MDLGLAGKVVIVTGATANIGRGIALDFAAEGAKVVAVGRDEDAGARVVEEAKRRGAQAAVFVRADLLDPESPARILAVAPYGTIADDPAAFSKGSRFNPETGFMLKSKAFAEAPAEDKAKRARAGVLPRPLAKPEDVSAAVLYLASDRAGFVTGTVMTV